MDVYGVGLTMLEALTGVAIFDPDIPAAERPDLPPLEGSSLTDLIRAMLDVDPVGRPTLPGAWAELAAITRQAGEPVSPAWTID